MAYATYQKQRVVEAAAKTVKRYGDRIEEHHREERERDERLIADAMRPRWWRRGRSREKAEKIVRKNKWHPWMIPTSIFLPWDEWRRAQGLLKLAQECDSETIELHDNDVRFLFS